MSGDGATIGINGFGRIGRAVLRAALGNPLLKVTAINDPYINAEYAAYLLSSDSSILNVEVKGDAIVVDGCFIEVTQRPDPSSIPWKVTYVIDCSGVYTTQERASQHLASGCSRVVVAAPGVDIPTFVVGVNADTFHPSMQVVCAGSPTGVVLASALKRLTASTTIDFVSFTAIHAATAQQKCVDGTNVKDWASARAASNIVPFVTGAQRTVQKTMPNVASTIIGNSFHVPTPSGCVLDVTLRTSGPLNKSRLEEMLVGNGDGAFVVASSVMASADVAKVVGSKRSPSAIGILDSRSTQLLGDGVAKFTLWYDNEVSYAKALLALVLTTNAKW